MSEGDGLPAIGRAARSACEGGELWRLPPEDQRVAARLVELGALGVGGFVRRGDDLVRIAGGGELTWPRLASLADALAACEQRSLFPGPLELEGVFVDGDRAHLRADALVHAMVGAPPPEVAAPKWLPPEYAGRAADNASNRYALGLIAYRVVTGAHPFAGRGLRAGLADQAERGAPPFSADAAASLPPGLQSLCLRMLDPDPARRPATAAAIAGELRELSESRTSCPASGHAARPGSRAPRPSSDPRPAGGHAGPPGSRAPRPSSDPPPAGGHAVRLRAAVWLAPLVAAAIVVVVALASAGAPSSRAATSVRPAEPMTRARELADCASCHPRQAAEWSRSVMAHSVESPLFQALEILIQEQVGKSADCPHGAGVLRSPGADPCRNRFTGHAVTGAGGAGWCVNCHAPGENLGSTLPAWNALSSDAGSRRPLRDLLQPAAMQGISCAACHQMMGPAHPGAAYEGNPTWTSPDTGRTYRKRPEDERGLFGIGESGYLLEPARFLSVGELSPGDAPRRPGAEPGADERSGELVPGGAHRRTDARAAAYRRSSEMCGACHDVRLFGADAVSGEPFKRLRNAYSEWRAWADDERRAGRPAASCQDCHMSLYPGVCEASPGAAAASGCPDGTAFRAVPPGTYPTGRSAAGSHSGRISTHYFSGVDVPLAHAFDPKATTDPTLDVAGIPLGARQRRDQLLARTFRFDVEPSRRTGDRIEIPVVVENIGAGHRVPAGFSQEREIWVHLVVKDATGRTLYEVGRIERGDEDLRDKTFLRISTDDAFEVDRISIRGRRARGAGAPQGVFGADVADGPDVPRWTPLGRTGDLRGSGLINFQNGFLRCVSCIGTIDEQGRCQPGPGQGRHRADRFVDAFYDQDTGACRSNLRGAEAFFEVYFPIGALDATRGVTKGPDAIVDTRSLPPRRPARHVYDLDVAGAVGPLTVTATLEFRAFPPYLIRAFIDYEARQHRAGLRPSGPLVDASVLERLDVVHVARATRVIE